MKAYSVSDKNGTYDFAFIIFAEKRAKAIKFAIDYCGAFDWCAWTDMRAIRKPELDRFYHGKPEMDWYNMEERVAMVRYAGFHCSEEADVTTDDCIKCAAHEWCDRYERMTC